MKILKILIPVILAVIIGISGVKLIKKRRAADEKLPFAEQIAITVKTLSPKIERKTLTLPYIATVKNDKEVVISTKFTGKILSIKELGSHVKKGETVVNIDGSELKAKLEEIDSQINSVKNKIYAETINLKNLKASHARTEKLLEVKMASIEQYQNEQSKIASLRAQIKADRNTLKALLANKKSILNNLTYTVLKSPIDGTVSLKTYNRGDIAFAGRTIIKITPEKGNYLFITLPKNYKKIIFENKEYNLTPLKNTYNSLKTFKAKIDDNNLSTGERVNVKVVEYEGEGVFLPYDAILTVNGKNYIFELKNGKAEAKEVKIKAQGEKYVLIDKNVTSDVILAKPDILLRIKAGYPVKMEN